MIGTISIQEKHSRGVLESVDHLFFLTNQIISLKKIHSLELFNHLLKLSVVRKMPETQLFQALGIIETLGSIISHGTSSKFADVRTHLRKVSNLI